MSYQSLQAIQYDFLVYFFLNTYNLCSKKIV